MNADNQYLVFGIDRQQYAVALSSVEKVIRAVELIHLPKSPEFVLGLINMHGRIIPVINIRLLFQVPERKMEVNDQIVISRIASRPVAFIADKVKGVFEFSPALIDTAGKILPGMENCIKGVVKFNSTSAVVSDLDRLFSRHDIMRLDDALDGH